MSMTSLLKKIANKCGFEINRYNIRNSMGCRFVTLLGHHEVDLVLDVGANDGGYGRFLRQHGYRGKILSFEPLPEAHARLVEATRGDPNWHVMPRMAIGSAEGEVEINVAANSVSSSLLDMCSSHLAAAPDSKYVCKEKVALTRLDTVTDGWIESTQRIFLKVDTQGYEKPVLDGALGILHKIVGVQLEMSIVPLYEKQILFRDMLGILEEKDYELWGIFPGFTDRTSGRLLQADGIFFKAPNR